MEAIEYNGIDLEALETLRFHRQHLRDAAGNYLKTRWEIDVICSYHPFQTSYTAGAPGQPPDAIWGSLPGVTDLSIRQALMAPRGLLIVTSGGSIILETPGLAPVDGRFPGKRFLTDAENGPFCEIVSVPRQIGIKHWLVQLRFLAHTVECDDSTSPVLSNTWSTVWDVDELFYPTKQVAGTAILRTDYMRDQQITADSLRSSFFFPIDDNYRRENIHVELQEDGATLLWSFTDVARCYNVDMNSFPGHRQIKDIDIFLTTRSSGGTPARARAEWRLANDIGAVSGLGGAVAAGYDALWNKVTGGSEVARLAANLPSHILNVRCDIWGDRGASMRDLTFFSLGICLQNALFSGFPFTLTTAEVSCRQELSSRFVSSEISYRWADNLRPMVTGIFTSEFSSDGQYLGADQGGGAVVLGVLLQDRPTISRRDLLPIPVPATPFAPPFVGTAVPVYSVLTQTDGPNPAPDFNCYAPLSQFIQKTVTQLLLSPCEAVPIPSLTGNRS